MAILGAILLNMLMSSVQEKGPSAEETTPTPGTPNSQATVIPNQVQAPQQGQIGPQQAPQPQQPSPQPVQGPNPAAAGGGNMGAMLAGLFGGGGGGGNPAPAGMAGASQPTAAAPAQPSSGGFGQGLGGFAQNMGAQILQQALGGPQVNPLSAIAGGVNRGRGGSAFGPGGTTGFAGPGTTGLPVQTGGDDAIRLIQMLLAEQPVGGFRR